MPSYLKKMQMRCTGHPAQDCLGRTFWVEMDWVPFVPMEVRMVTERGGQEWRFARDLLLTGLWTPTAIEKGDVQFYPLGSRVYMSLASDDFAAEYSLAKQDVEAFVNPTVARVDPRAEPALWLDWDVQLICLLAGSVPPLEGRS